MQERRKSPRDEAFLIADINGETVYIADISEYGMKITSQSKIGGKGDTIKLSIQIPSQVLEDLVINANIAWLIEKDSFCSYGIEIINRDAIEEKLNYIKELNEFISSMRRNLLT